MTTVRLLKTMLKTYPDYKMNYEECIECNLKNPEHLIVEFQTMLNWTRKRSERQCMTEENVNQSFYSLILG